VANKKPITVEDLWQIERLGEPSLSPDGMQAVVALTCCSMDKNSSSSTLWLMSTQESTQQSTHNPAPAKNPRPLTHCGDKDGQPLWSPSGQQVAFTAKREQEGQKDKQTQLYLIDTDGGEARRVSEVATGVNGVRWCPGGKQLLFISWVWPELKGAKAQAARAKEFAERKESGYATSQAQYRHWDHNLPMGRVPHLHLLKLNPRGGVGKTVDLFEGSDFELTRADPDANHYDVSPDGTRVVFAFNPDKEKRGDARFALAELDMRSGKTQVIAQDKDWDFGNPRYNPDGQRVAFVASHQALKHTMPGQLAVWDREEGRFEVVSAQWDHEVQAPLHWEDDGQAVLFCTEDKGRRPLWRFDLPDRRAEVVVASGWVSAFDKAAGTLVTVSDSAMHPAQMHAHLAGQTPLRLERFNDQLMQGLDLGRVEEVWFKGAATQAGAAISRGDDVQMWLVYPPGFDKAKKYPVMHNIHGGPHTGPGDNWHYRWNTQVFAAQGYVVASVNFHGSSGFGHAFLDSITHRWGELELQDIEAATDWLLKKPFTDRKRVFATGGSYGGFMVAWMNGHLKPGRYQAYVCHAGCFDWVGMFADDAWHWHAKELGAWYWNNMPQIHSQSPHAYASGMSTPTLVIHGALDYRVPDAQGLAYYNTLKALNVDARLLWFPDENHWILKPRNSKLWFTEFFAWLKRHDPGSSQAKSTNETRAAVNKTSGSAVKGRAR